MIRLLTLAAMVIVSTAIFTATVIFEEPPAFIAYTFGLLNGASWVGLVALYVIRRQTDD